MEGRRKKGREGRMKGGKGTSELALYSYPHALLPLSLNFFFFNKMRIMKPVWQGHCKASSSSTCKGEKHHTKADYNPWHGSTGL